MSKKMKKGFSRKAFLFALAAVLLIGCSVGGTLAWLTANTGAVTNTFTVGDIEIDLAESEELDLKMVPGCTIAKDPKVTVKAGSEACWLFVKIEESNVDDFITYNVAEGWTALTDVNGVYYREVPATTADTAFDILKDNQVTVKDTVTKEMMNGLTTEEIYPTLTFTAYACQLYRSNNDPFEVAEAWTQVQQ